MNYKIDDILYSEKLDTIVHIDYIADHPIMPQPEYLLKFEKFSIFFFRDSIKFFGFEIIGEL